jgi:hypothetical protein
MPKRYVYKNVNKSPVNIGGYQFEEGQELESDIRINGFNGAVSNGFLELTERKPEGAEQDATQAPQTGNTGKVKVIFHMGIDAEGGEVLKEVELDPGIPVEFPNLAEFPNIDVGKNETFGGWFKDAEFAKPVNLDKARAPKEGDLHFYGKYRFVKKEDTPPVNPNPNGGDRQATFPPFPSPPAGDKPALTDPETK